MPLLPPTASNSLDEQTHIGLPLLLANEASWCDWLSGLIVERGKGESHLAGRPRYPDPEDRPNLWPEGAIGWARGMMSLRSLPKMIMSRRNFPPERLFDNFGWTFTFLRASSNVGKAASDASPSVQTPISTESAKEFDILKVFFPFP